MGKKGSWLSAIKRVFSHNPKEKQVNELEWKNPKETKKKVRVPKHGETKSFIPMFREPSSIEEILGEIDEKKLLIRPLTPFEPPNATPVPTPTDSVQKATSPKAPFIRLTSPKAGSPKASSKAISPKAAFIRVTSPKAASSRDINLYNEIIKYRPEPSLQYRNLSATKIQAAYKGYVARRSCRALRGLVRLQGVVRGQNVKRQTTNAMKMMQFLVRVQTQIQSRRIQMFENQAHKFDKELDSSLGKLFISQSEAGNQKNWDYSTVTKEEREARMQKKMEAVSKRERAMAYTYSHQSRKSNAKSAQPSLADVPLDGFPWWPNWTEHQIPTTNTLSPPRRTPEPKQTPRPPPTHKSPCGTPFDHQEATTPTSTRSMAPIRSNHFMPTPTRKYKPGRASSEMGLNDDNSFLVPNYMTPTASARAKIRAVSNPKERFPGTPGNDSKKRFSFPLTKGSSKKDFDSESAKSFHYPGDYSAGSVISMPVGVGRKPFNRFV